eukprot:647324-Lingulodinium_polyedra.AAC.1
MGEPWRSSRRSCSSTTRTPRTSSPSGGRRACGFGKLASTDERVLGTPGGMVLSRSVARRPGSKRWQGDI